MPYCLHKVEDKHGGWIPLNRLYKPLGQPGGDWVDYGNVPPECRLKRLSRETAILLSWNGEGKTNEKAVFLYYDGSSPFRSRSHWDSYSKKLARLTQLMIKG